MKEVKFICPSCGQHVQCDWNHAGENVPCPACAVLIRVPIDGSLADVPAPQAEASPFAPTIGDSETVSYVRTQSDHDTGQEKSPVTAAERAAEEGSSVPPLATNSTLPAAQNEEPPVSAPAEHTSELHCVCPVCQSELRISVEPEPALGGALHTAGLTQMSAEHLSAVERERQIAAARAVSLRPTMKPRLNRILSDKAATSS